MTKKGQQKLKAGKEIVEQDNKTQNTPNDEEEVNSGFHYYLRSSTGL